MNNKLQIKGITKEQGDFITKTVKLANDNGFRVELIDQDKVDGGDGYMIDGYMTDSTDRVLSVATGKPVSEWMPIFVHESCHLDQCIEKADVWTTLYINGIDIVDLVFLWVDEHIDLNPKQLDDYIARTLQVELDAERRSLVKISQFDLGINKEQYARAANAYVYFYLVMKQTRRWFENSPYTIPEILRVMPEHMNNDYSVLSKSMLNLYVQHCWSDVYNWQNQEVKC